MKMSYHGPVTISAYGDTNGIPSSVQQFLSSTGIGLNHVPDGLRMLVIRKIWWICYFGQWTILHLPIICSFQDFSSAIHQLWVSRYNILLAQPFKASPTLAAATNLRQWTSLVIG